VPYAAAVELAAQEGRFEAAAALIEEAIAYVGQADASRYLADFARVAAWPMAELGLLAGRLGDRDGQRASSARFERLLGLVDAARLAVDDAGGPLGALLRWNRAQVLAERARMEGAATAQTWRDVTEGWTTLGFPYRALYARWRHAEAAASLDDRVVASETLRAAHEDATRLGARPLAAQMEGLARKLRLRLGAADSPSQASPEPLDAASAAGLTPREREVLALVAAGRTNRQVAEQLFISESTAGVHVSNILGKLGVATRTEAAREAINRGLVDT
jgi:DNA-binding CsgD family transcriptional regulator